MHPSLSHTPDCLHQTPPPPASPKNCPRLSDPETLFSRNRYSGSPNGSIAQIPENFPLIGWASGICPCRWNCPRIYREILPLLIGFRHASRGIWNSRNIWENLLLALLFFLRICIRESEAIGCGRRIKIEKKYGISY